MSHSSKILLPECPSLITKEFKTSALRKVHRPRSPRPCWAEAFRRAIPLKKAMTTGRSKVKNSVKASEIVQKFNIHMSNAVQKSELSWAPLKVFTFPLECDPRHERVDKHQSCTGGIRLHGGFHWRGWNSQRSSLSPSEFGGLINTFLPNSQTVVVKVLLIQILPLYIYIYYLYTYVYICNMYI